MRCFIQQVAESCIRSSYLGLTSVILNQKMIICGYVVAESVLNSTTSCAHMSRVARRSSMKIPVQIDYFRYTIISNCLASLLSG